MGDKEMVYILDSIISNIFTTLCQPISQPNKLAMNIMAAKVKYLNMNIIDRSRHSGAAYRQTLITCTGSSVEFYIKQPVSCIGDIDLMFCESDALAVPEIRSTDTVESSGKKLWKITPDGQHPGFVLLVRENVRQLSDRRQVCVQTMSNTFEFQQIATRDRSMPEITSKHVQGPALCRDSLTNVHVNIVSGDVTEYVIPIDYVYSVLCLYWPSQAEGWASRQRRYGWPSDLTIRRVLQTGCDVVPATHRDCKNNTSQWRLSFSRAETILLKSLKRHQQIVYHMLRSVVKKEFIIDRDYKRGDEILCTYHIKTLMLWACEKMAPKWWNRSSLVAVCRELLITLTMWLRSEKVPHYFIEKSNLLDYNIDTCKLTVVVNKMIALTYRPATLVKWFICNYICQVLVYDIDLGKPRHVLLEQIDFRQFDELMEMLQSPLVSPDSNHVAELDACTHFLAETTKTAQMNTQLFLICSKDLPKVDSKLYQYFIANIKLNVAFKVHVNQFVEIKEYHLDLLDEMFINRTVIKRNWNNNSSTTCYTYYRKAVTLLKLSAKKKPTAADILMLELSKEYLYKVINLKKCISCAALFYLTIIFYMAGNYETAVVHCRFATQFPSRNCPFMIRTSLLPHTTEIDNSLGFVALCQYVLRQGYQQVRTDLRTRYEARVTPALFLHYFEIVLRQKEISRTELVDLLTRYKLRFIDFSCCSAFDVCNYALCQKKLKEIEREAVRAYHIASSTRGNDNMLEAQIAVQLKHRTDLVNVLIRSAVEDLTMFHRSLADDKAFETIFQIADHYKVLQVYKYGGYRQALNWSLSILANPNKSLTNSMIHLVVLPEYLTLFDNDFASMIGLATLRHRDVWNDPMNCVLNPLVLIIYVAGQCLVGLTSLSSMFTYAQIVAVLKLTSRLLNKRQGTLSIMEYLLLTFIKHRLKGVTYNCVDC